MPTKNPEAQLVQLLSTASTAVSGNNSVVEILKRIAQAVTERLKGSSVSITLRTRIGHAIAAGLHEGSEHTGAAPFVVFSRKVIVRGWEYGQVRVWLTDPSTPPVATLQTLETLTQLLGVLAERASLLEQQGQLRRQTELLRAKINEEKLMTRAAGIVAAVKLISQRQAERWIESEARHSGRSILVVADRIVLERTLQGLRTPLPLEPALGRTA